MLVNFDGLPLLDRFDRLAMNYPRLGVWAVHLNLVVPMSKQWHAGLSRLYVTNAHLLDEWRFRGHALRHWYWTAGPLPMSFINIQDSVLSMSYNCLLIMWKLSLSLSGRDPLK